MLDELEYNIVCWMQHMWVLYFSETYDIVIYTLKKLQGHFSSASQRLPVYVDQTEVYFSNIAFSPLHHIYRKMFKGLDILFSCVIW